MTNIVKYLISGGIGVILGVGASLLYMRHWIKNNVVFEEDTLDEDTKEEILSYIVDDAKAVKTAYNKVMQSAKEASKSIENSPLLIKKEESEKLEASTPIKSDEITVLINQKPDDQFGDYYAMRATYHIHDGLVILDEIPEWIDDPKDSASYEDLIKDIVEDYVDMTEIDYDDVAYITHKDHNTIYTISFDI